MPNRRKRLSPGQTYGGGGGGGIDLGAILMGIYGGVESNPDFMAEVDRPSEDFVGAMPAKKTAGDPFKAKTVFDRNEASRMNASFKTDNYLADQDIVRDLTRARGMVPIRGDEAYATNSATLKAQREHEEAGLPFQLNKQAELDKLETEKQKALEIIKMLTGKGVIPNAADQSVYEQQINPRILEALGQKATADAQASIAAGLNSKIQSQVLEGTAPNTIASELAGSALNRKLSEGRLGNADTILKSEMDLIRQKPALNEIDSLTRRMGTVQPGGTIIDTITGKPRYTAPTALQNMQSGNAAPSGAPSSGLRGYRIEDLIIDPATGEILATKPRR